jgi:uncharacterized protein YjbJ (UPF0337 family)
MRCISPSRVGSLHCGRVHRCPAPKVLPDVHEEQRRSHATSSSRTAGRTGAASESAGTAAPVKDPPPNNLDASIVGQPEARGANRSYRRHAVKLEKDYWTLDTRPKHEVVVSTTPPRLVTGVQLNLEEDCMKESTKDKVKGTVDKVKGSVKEKVGRATNDPDLESEGTAQKVAGKVEKKVGDVKKVFEK